MSRTLTTQTRAGPGGPYRASRTYDFLYDPLYTLSSEKDHVQTTYRAHMSYDRVQRVPEYPTMFSELVHHPRHTLRLQLRDPVPSFIDRQWRGRGEQRMLALRQLAGSQPTFTTPWQHVENQDVSGSNRYKYFERPLIPFSQQAPSNVLLAGSRRDRSPRPERAPTPLVRTVAIQTDYRDSETQTDPYSPEFVVQAGSVPEILMLANLTWGRGLPARLAEVEMIERAREKRAWEATLPPLSDVTQLEKRRKMMDEQERNEWAFREQEMEKLQEARLEALKKLLQQRKASRHEEDTKRLDGRWGKLQTEKEERIKQIQKEHIKAIRKLTKKMENVEGKLEKRDVLQDYSNYASQTYAPLSRTGYSLDRLSAQYSVKSPFLDSYQGLLDLEANLPDFVTQPRVRSPKHRTTTRDGFLKRQALLDRELKQVHEALLKKKNRSPEPEKPLRFLQKIEKPAPRPVTPRVPEPPEGEEEKELAVIFLQKLIRGRAVQNMMFEGKEKRVELIRELRTTHALQEEGRRLKKEDRQETLALQRQRELDQHKAAAQEEHVSRLEGEVLSETFDFLSKELVRLQEERRIHAFAVLAERHRRIREAEESGRRQVEERRRREEDEIFRQVVNIHQSTVDSYLEDVILGATRDTAEEQAREEIQRRAQEINEIAYQMESSRTRLQSEEIVAELVYSFLIPEIQKTAVRGRVRSSQRRHIAAAHRIIHGNTETLLSAEENQSQPTTEAEGEGEEPQ
ncbi:cilia- and flagella-associated protein 91 [Rana temporaria]|uniref:cilia- and flagella-associated protein 91 n=1 Tax=Rana temporaria TaxID=8407 RepID=UPI001AAD4050|nr:cilia- and flagella-associated protein 91 [Rana temporaria]